jgi:vancomycin resistance protein YoaR
MKFEDTTGHLIVVDLAADRENVNVKIYGALTAWEIDVGSPKISNVVNPDSQIVSTGSPEVPKGDELQVERAQEGFDASILRTVTSEKGETVL